MTEICRIILVHASIYYPILSLWMQVNWTSPITPRMELTRKFCGLNEECVSEHLSPEDFSRLFVFPPNGPTFPLSSTCAADVHFSFLTTKGVILCAKYLWVIDHFKQALQPSQICVLSAGYCCCGSCYYSNWEQVFLRPGSLHTPHFSEYQI